MKVTENNDYTYHFRNQNKKMSTKDVKDNNSKRTGGSYQDKVEISHLGKSLSKTEDKPATQADQFGTDNPPYKMNPANHKLINQYEIFVKEESAGQSLEHVETHITLNGAPDSERLAVIKANIESGFYDKDEIINNVAKVISDELLNKI